MERTTAYLLASFTIILSTSPKASAQGAHVQPTQYTITDSILVGRVLTAFYAIDDVRHQLYGAGAFVVNARTKRVTPLEDSLSGGGFGIASDLGRGLIRNGVVFDLSSGRVVTRLPVLGDRVVYDRLTRRAFVIDDTIAVVDMTKPAAIAHIPTVGNLGAAASDGSGHLYVVVSGKPGFVLEIDTRQLAIINTFSVPDEYPKGLAVDGPHRRLFVACYNRLTVLDADDGRTVATIATPGLTPESGFDPALKLLFQPGGQGNGLTIVHEDTPNEYSVFQTLNDPRLTSTRVIVDTTTHSIYIPHRMADSSFAFLVLNPVSTGGTSRSRSGAMR
jgi:hypothetical protein